MTWRISRAKSWSGALVMAAMLGCASSSAIAVPVDPVISYLFDDDTTPQFGTVTGTLAGAGGTQTSGPTYNASTPISYAGNKSLLFDGTDDRVGIGLQTVGQAISGSSAITFASWIRYETGNLKGDKYNNIFFVSRMGLSNTGRANVWANVRNDAGNVGKVLIGGRSTTTDGFQEISSSAAITAGEWHLVVGILDFANDQVKISVDGGALQSAAASFNSATYVNEANPSTEVDTVSEGAILGNNPWKGYVDEVAIFDTALNPDDITFLYQNGLSAIPEPASLVPATLGVIAMLRLAGRQRRR